METRRNAAIRSAAASVVCLLFLAIGFLAGDQRDIWYLHDRDILAPYYAGRALKYGITGTMIFQIRFSDRKVSSVDLVRSSLSVSVRPDVPQPDAYEQLILADIQAKMKATIRQWTTPFVGDNTHTVAIRLTIDDRLEPTKRRYNVDYGLGGVPSLIEIVGPGKKWKSTIGVDQASDKPKE